MNCIIIEDEINSRILLQEMLAMYLPQIKLLGVGSSVSEGVTLIDKLNPDVILLDIEITEGSGFDLLDQIKNKNAKVIFITGYEHYALKAIKYAAIDYLLKPISIEDLKAAFAKMGSTDFSGEKLSVLTSNLESKSGPEQMMVPQGKGFTVVPLQSISYLEANGPYVYIHFDDKKKILASHSLGYYEEMLDETQFFRIHKSILVNIKKIIRVITQPTLQVYLENDVSLDLAVRRKESFMEIFRKISR